MSEILKSRISAGLLLLVLCLGSGLCRADEQMEQATDTDTWGGLGLSLGAGLSMFPYKLGSPSSLQKQIEGARMDMPVCGGVFDLSVECELMGWLVLGAEFDYYLNMVGSAEGLNQYFVPDPEVSSGLDCGFHRLVGLAFVQVDLIGLFPNPGQKQGSEKGSELGLRFAIGGGGLIWTLRGERDVGRIFEMRPSLEMGSVWDDWSLHWSIGFPFQWISDLGPYALSHVGLSANVGMRVRYRL